ncbi:cupredoxin domain-containing protein [Aquimarina sp. 2201CG1-2-11]|uniref:cupredoxin domain-containing protein n=1 Tax=Aquimarina discodermiae TaxID=3231043 RepID=UPI0034618A78
MKKLIALSTFILVFTFSAFAQDTKTVTLEQTKGEFTQKEIKISEGSYVFEIKNSGVDHEVGFVLAPKSNPKAHIKTAYVTKAVATGKTEKTKVTKLEKGEYVYFCPLNPTPQYTLVVE